MHKQAMLILAAVSGIGLWAQLPGIEYKTFGPLETKTVTGAPYSATAITTFTQTLADGTHITRTVTAQVARDSQGRTRREETLNAIGPLSGGGSEKHLIAINDPVEQSHYVLVPDQQIAMKGPAASIATLKASARWDQAPTKVTTSGGNVKFVAKEGAMMILGSPEEKAQVEDLGDQMIEGARAHGRREKRTIAVGEIGNDRPIDVSSETWFSDDLQTIVLSKRIDPRVGDSEYRLTNISRVEPQATLFEVPAGYTVRQEGKLRE